MIAKQALKTFTKPFRTLLRADDFIYLLPHPALRHLISNYTITFPNKHIISSRYTVIPHGCATLVFSCDASHLCGNLFGPITRPCVVGGLANLYDMLLILEFQPAGLYAFTGLNQKELANQTHLFDCINARLNKLLLDALEGTGNLDDLVDRLDNILLESLHRSYPSELQAATAMVLEHAGSLSQQQLSASVYYSQRHMNRIFEHYLGMNTKTFSRMVRINKAIRLLQNPQYSITRAACETGFYDLPHLIHEMKAVCGMTPQEYRSNMSDFYSELAKF